MSPRSSFHSKLPIAKLPLADPTFGPSEKSFMTTPFERTRAVIQTEAFLKRLELDETVGHEVREMANQLLRHFPSKGEVIMYAHCEDFLPEPFRSNLFFSTKR